MILRRIFDKHSQVYTDSFLLSEATVRSTRTALTEGKIIDTSRDTGTNDGRREVHQAKVSLAVANRVSVFEICWRLVRGEELYVGEEGETRTEEEFGKKAEEGWQNIDPQKQPRLL